MKLTKQSLFLLVIVSVALLSGCGSGIRSNAVPTQDSNPQSNVAVAVAPGLARLILGGTQQYTAIVSGFSNASVVWTVNGVIGGNDIVGTISATGLYTAPSTVPAVASVLITATVPTARTSGAATAFLSATASSHFAYVASPADDAIEIFTANDQVLEPKSIFSVAPGTGPTTLSMHPSGKLLYSLNRGSNDISIFTIDLANGDLSAAGTAPVPNGPHKMVFSPRGDLAYVACDGASVIAPYAINVSTGALTPLNGTPFLISGTIKDIALTPDGKFLYATDGANNQVVGLTINPDDGSLSAMEDSPFPATSGLYSIVASATYVYTSAAASIDTFQRDVSSGSLHLLESTVVDGNAPKLFSNLSSDFLLGVDSLKDGFFSYELDYPLYAYHPAVSTGNLPVAGGLLLNVAYYPSAYVLNRNSDTAVTKGSIGLYLIAYDGAYGPQTTVPTAVNNPTDFAITP